MNKISALWDLFRKGECVADPAKWKARQITATVLGAAIMAAIQALKAFGIDIAIDENSALAIAGGVIAVVNVVLTITTTDKIGLPAKQAMPSSSIATSVKVQNVNNADVQDRSGMADGNTGTTLYDLPTGWK